MTLAGMCLGVVTEKYRIKDPKDLQVNSGMDKWVLTQKLRKRYRAQKSHLLLNPPAHKAKSPECSQH